MEKDYVYMCLMVITVGEYLPLKKKYYIVFGSLLVPLDPIAKIIECSFK